MNVCFVSGVFPPHVSGGAENYVLTVAKRLDAEGHRPSVLTTEPFDGLASLTPRLTTYEGIDIWRFSPLNVADKTSYERYSLPRQTLWRAIDVANPHSLAMVERVLDRTAPDVVHVNELEGISTLAARAAAGSDAAYVHTLHNYNLLSPGSTVRVDGVPGGADRSFGNHPLVSSAFARVQRALMETPDTVIGPSQFIIDAHRRQGFFEDVPCRRLQHGVERVAESPSAPPTTPTVLYASRLAPEKGIETLLTTATSLPEVRFHVCGSGPLAGRVERRADDASNLTYHGFVSEADLWSLRRNATVGVVPSVWAENSPLTIYESYAAGLPIVGSAIGGIPELIVPGETGALFEPGRPGALVGALGRVFEGGTESMRANALDWARAHTLETHVESLVDVYERAARRGDR